MEVNTLKNQSQNLKYLVIEHNSTSRELDVSIHFNSSSCTDRGLGVDLLYVSLAEYVSKSLKEGESKLEFSSKAMKVKYNSPINSPATKKLLVKKRWKY